MNRIITSLSCVLSLSSALCASDGPRPSLTTAASGGGAGGGGAIIPFVEISLTDFQILKTHFGIERVEPLVFPRIYFAEKKDIPTALILKVCTFRADYNEKRKGDT